MTGHLCQCLCPAVASAPDLLLSRQKGVAQRPPAFWPMPIVAKRWPISKLSTYYSLGRQIILWFRWRLKTFPHLSVTEMHETCN